MATETPEASMVSSCPEPKTTLLGDGLTKEPWRKPPKSCSASVLPLRPSLGSWSGPCAPSRMCSSGASSSAPPPGVGALLGGTLAASERFCEELGDKQGRLPGGCRHLFATVPPADSSNNEPAMPNKIFHVSHASPGATECACSSPPNTGCGGDVLAVVVVVVVVGADVAVAVAVMVTVVVGAAKTFEPSKEPMMEFKLAPLMGDVSSWALATASSLPPSSSSKPEAAATRVRKATMAEALPQEATSAKPSSSSGAS
mmetsp:Transcript_83161/g.162989  ORF Transcript_83161/g.162989 Transcript_83161/m.162989 type:complete len:257 (+) Transcript_83161:197-967(+)